MQRITANDAIRSRGGVRRQQILEYLQAHPGASLRAVCLGTGMAVGVGRHHIGILERLNMAWHERLGAKDWYFAGKAPRARDAMGQALRSGLPGHLRQALRFVQDEGPVCQREALDALPWPRSTSQHRLDQLVRMGHVHRKPQGRRVLYEVVR